ncbi:MAG TPA: hypothetical protein VK602_12520, partial [Phyllobacterium sp.]|nr:hypothetical protein [Phyllobacterium sp.]
IDDGLGFRLVPWSPMPWAQTKSPAAVRLPGFLLNATKSSRNSHEAEGLATSAPVTPILI